MNLYKDGVSDLSYKATINATFALGEDTINIESQRIRYLLFEHNYDSELNHFPVAYLSLYCSNDVYNNIIKSKGNGRITLDISIEPIKNGTVIGKHILTKSFKYSTSATDPNYRQALSRDAFTDNDHTMITLGLECEDINDKLRTTFNEIMLDTTCESIMAKALEGLSDPVVEKPTYNDWYESFTIPPTTSRVQLLETLFRENPFYDTKYTFFMDFDYQYLMSKTGEAISLGDGSPDNVYIDIQPLTAGEAYVDGMEIKNDSYYIYLNPAAANVTLDQSTEKVANKIITVTDEGDPNETTLSINTSGQEKPIYVRDKDAAVYRNEIEKDAVSIEFIKHHLDATVFTPNKTYYVNNYSDYTNYNGKYLLSSKRVYLAPVQGSEYFGISTIVRLNKLGRITPLNRMVITRPDDYVGPGEKVDGNAAQGNSAAIDASRGTESVDQRGTTHVPTKSAKDMVAMGDSPTEGRSTDRTDSKRKKNKTVVKYYKPHTVPLIEPVYSRDGQPYSVKPTVASPAKKKKEGSPASEAAKNKLKDAAASSKGRNRNLPKRKVVAGAK